MPTSKIRQDLPIPTDDLSVPVTGDLTAYAICTRRKAGETMILAGYLDAPDDQMAMIFAKEHYGQDQECVEIWAFPSHVIAGTLADQPTSNEAGECRSFQTFLQKERGEVHVAGTKVQANCSEAALELAKQSIPDTAACHNLWVVDWKDITATRDGEMIWRTTDQTYRLARGYSKDVRQKWEAIRAAREVDEYQSEDLQNTF